MEQGARPVLQRLATIAGRVDSRDLTVNWQGFFRRPEQFQWSWTDGTTRWTTGGRIQLCSELPSIGTRGSNPKASLTVMRLPCLDTSPIPKAGSRDLCGAY
ncbi:unnamed protein product [Symbiodinium pilosum]|uniref:Uncharacterized protein n=1 Tax=Symbiodinium pilosum TaxID=2952 RepID=A0A812Y6S8_SYMPI|nr:unnamed protein product [Symbiodinium pilosum]